MQQLRHATHARLFRPASLLLALSLLGCAGSLGSARSHGGPPRSAPTAAPATPSISGTWDWVFRSNNEQGDLRIEQEVWHLEQGGGRLSGYYDRMVTILSTDQRPFQCNGALGFSKNSRVRITGEVRGDTLTVQEVAADVQPGPCDTGQRNLISYTGRVQGNSLVLQFAPGGSQYLTRRAAGAVPLAPAERAAAAAGLPSLGPGTSEQQAARVPLDGAWDWELSTVDADGDLRAEREVWRLSESEAGISGSYERTVQRTRTGSVFSCNGEPVIHSVTQYTIRGQRFGDRLTLSEVDYKAQAGPCDNALRRLDTYQGAVSPSGQELLLSWGQGSQILRRRH